MAEQTTAIPLSSLPEIKDNPGDFWVFASTEAGNGSMESGKFNLAEYLNGANKMLQLERRISLTMETNTHTMFIGETMSIYKIETLNVSKLVINEQEVSLPLAEPIEIPPRSLVSFTIERSATDPTAYLFIYAKAKEL